MPKQRRSLISPSTIANQTKHLLRDLQNIERARANVVNRQVVYEQLQSIKPNPATIPIQPQTSGVPAITNTTELLALVTNSYVFEERHNALVSFKDNIWRLVNNFGTGPNVGLRYNTHETFRVLQNKIFIGTAANIGDTGLYVSTDRGVTFNKVFDNPVFSLDEANGKLWLVGDSPQKAVYSSTNGITWTLEYEVNNSSIGLSVSADPTANRAFSYNTWTIPTIEPASINPYNSILEDPHALGVLGTKTSIFTNTGKFVAIILLEIDDEEFIGYDHVFIISGDDGSVRNEILTAPGLSLSATNTMFSYSRNPLFFAIGDWVNGNKIRVFRSLNDAISWEELPSPIGEIVENTPGSLLYDKQRDMLWVTSFLNDAPPVSLRSLSGAANSPGTWESKIEGLTEVFPAVDWMGYTENLALL